MSDATRLEITIKKTDFKKLEDALHKFYTNENNSDLKNSTVLRLFCDENEEYGNQIDLKVSEADNAYVTELEFLAKENILFYGHHWEGGEYDGCNFVSYNGNIIYVTIDVDTNPMINIDWNMNISLDLIKEFEEYSRYYDIVDSYIEDKNIINNELKYYVVKEINKINGKELNNIFISSAKTEDEILSNWGSIYHLNNLEKSLFSDIFNTEILYNGCKEITKFEYNILKNYISEIQNKENI